MLSLRRLLRLPPLPISRDEAVRIVLDEAARRGWVTDRVDRVDGGLFFYKVWLVHAKPSAYARVSGRTGRIVEWYQPRGGR